MVLLLPWLYCITLRLEEDWNSGDCKHERTNGRSQPEIVPGLPPAKEWKIKSSNHGELNLANNRVNLEEDSKPQKGIQPSWHLDLNLDPEQRDQFSCAPTCALKKPWDNTCMFFQATNFMVICYIAVENWHTYGKCFHLNYESPTIMCIFQVHFLKFRVNLYV